MTDITSIISDAAQQHGQDPALMVRMGQIESGLNPNAYNSGSGASGLFQFVPSTAKAYGLSNPQDPTANADAAARLLADNRAALAKALGRDPTGGELYLAHQQGAGGAAALLAHPDEPAASVVGTRAVVSNGGAQGMTSRQYTGMWLSRFGGAQPPASTSIGSLFATGGVQPVAAATLPATSATLSPDAVLASQLPLDDTGAPIVPQRAPKAANGGVAAAEAKRRALITGNDTLGALFAR